ncbi:MAG: ABC transporter permease subunit [Bdellovibrionales bacterium]
MIEKRFKNELSLKRYRKLKANRLSMIGFWALIVISFFSVTAEFWANSKPVYMSYEGKSYFPVLKKYHPTDFGRDDMLVMDYRDLEKTTNAKIIWPVVKWDPFESNKTLDFYPAPPTGSNWFGTDDRGRDIFTRLLYGFRYCFAYAILVWSITTLVGVLAGGVMGFFGGKVDLVSQRVVEVLNSVPQFFLLLIIVSIFQPNLMWLVAISSIFGWIFISYYIRGEFLKNRRMEFVEAARALGASKRSIILRHILPNSLGPVITFGPFLIAAHITGLASLDYLGFGLVPPTPSWGELLNQAQQHFSTSWWLAIYPSLALFMTLLFLNLVGEGVRDAFDPRK